MRKAFPLVLAAALIIIGSHTIAGNEKQPETDVEITGFYYEPAKLEPTEERLRKLQVPEGFRVEKWADNLGHARILAVADDGTVYLTRRNDGDVLMLRDTNRDGKADQRQTVAQRPQLHGITLHRNRAYLMTNTELFVADRKPDGALGDMKRLMSGLPDGGQHPNRTLAVGPDNMLYMSIGSSCNACPEPNPEHATMLKTDLEGKSRTIFAKGLRNTIGFGWHPETREFWGMDHGTDWLGNDEQHEELNLIREGEHYGWPYVYDNRKKHPKVAPEKEDHDEFAKRSIPPHLLYTPHAAPMQMVFYTGNQFPADYRGDAFVAMRGSWNRRPPVGYEIVRIKFQNGKPARFEKFVQGFLTELGNGRYDQMGRLCGLAQTPDGALLFTDDENGVIYRVSYAQPRAAE